MKHVIKQKSFKKWKEKSLPELMLFEPGYRACGVFGGTEGWDSKANKWEGKELNAEEAFFVLESFGLDPWEKCNEKTEFLELVSRKDVMNLMIGMWKEDLANESGLFQYALWVDIFNDWGHPFIKRKNLWPKNKQAVAMVMAFLLDLIKNKKNIQT